VYRRAKLAEKKGKESFHNLVLRCLSTEEDDGKGGLSKRRVRKFSRRAHHYILAYFYIENNQEKCIEGELSELNIERIKRSSKCTEAPLTLMKSSSISASKVQTSQQQMQQLESDTATISKTPLINE
jgi:hypothetical protein